MDTIIHLDEDTLIPRASRTGNKHSFNSEKRTCSENFEQTRRGAQYRRAEDTDG